MTSVDILAAGLDRKLVAAAVDNTAARQKLAGARQRRRAPLLPPVGECARPNGQVYKPRAIGPHEDLALLRKARELGQHVLLYGPPGTGKNALVEAAFAHAGLEIVTGSAELTETDLFGTFVQDPATGSFTWSPGPLPRSIAAGVPLFVDEIMLIDPKVLSVLYGLMDGSGVLRIPANPTLPAMQVPDGWFVVGAGNPDVDGAQMSEALRSRFFHHIEIGTDWDLAESMGVPPELVRVAANLDLRRRDGAIRWSPQMRELLTFVQISDVYGRAYAADSLLAACPADDLDTVRKAMHGLFPHAKPARLEGRYGT